MNGKSQKMPVVKIRCGHAVNGVCVDVEVPSGKTSARFYPSQRAIVPEAHQLEAAATHAVYLSELLGARICISMHTNEAQFFAEAKVKRAAVAQCVSVVGLLVPYEKN